MHEKTAVLLLSRQPIRPHRTTEWVQCTLDALQWIKENGCVLITSSGMQTWELQIALARILDLPFKLVIAVGHKESPERRVSWIREQFELGPGHQIEILRGSEAETKRDLMRRRDHTIARRANILIPVSVRSGGTMASLLETHQDKRIIRTCMTVTAGKPQAVSYSWGPDALSEDLLKISGTHLFHWTRASRDAWPDETRLDYYKAILESEQYPRNAFHTLQNILATQRIYASTRHMPAGYSTVSFSGLPPREMAGLMKWRSRYREMSFEPYGIGIQRQWAMRNGIRPVEYLPTSRDKPKGELWLRQSVGTISDWRNEDEYRHLSDLDLSRIPKDRLRAICFTSEEAAEIESRFGLPATAFTSS